MASFGAALRFKICRADAPKSRFRDFFITLLAGAWGVFDDALEAVQSLVPTDVWQRLDSAVGALSASIGLRDAAYLGYALRAALEDDDEDSVSAFWIVGAEGTEDVGD